MGTLECWREMGTERLRGDMIAIFRFLKVQLMKDGTNLFLLLQMLRAEPKHFKYK